MLTSFARFIFTIAPSVVYILHLLTNSAFTIIGITFCARFFAFARVACRWPVVPISKAGRFSVCRSPPDALLLFTLLCFDCDFESNRFLHPFIVFGFGLQAALLLFERRRSHCTCAVALMPRTCGLFFFSFCFLPDIVLRFALASCFLAFAWHSPVSSRLSRN